MLSMVNTNSKSNVGILTSSEGLFNNKNLKRKQKYILFLVGIFLLSCLTILYLYIGNNSKPLTANLNSSSPINAAKPILNSSNVQSLNAATESTNNTSVVINGKSVNVPANGSYTNTTTDSSGQTTININSSHTSNSSGSSASNNSSTSVNVNSTSGGSN